MTYETQSEKMKVSQAMKMRSLPEVYITRDCLIQSVRQYGESEMNLRNDWKIPARLDFVLKR